MLKPLSTNQAATLEENGTSVGEEGSRSFGTDYFFMLYYVTVYKYGISYEAIVYFVCWYIFSDFKFYIFSLFKCSFADLGNKRHCNHFCKNKAVCAHDCCEYDVFYESACAEVLPATAC